MIGQNHRAGTARRSRHHGLLGAGTIGGCGVVEAHTARTTHTRGRNALDEIKSPADLLDLHEIDLEIDRLLDERASLPELDQYKAAHGDVTHLESEKTAADAALKTIELGLDKTNGELEIMAIRAAAEHNRLYAGGISARDADYLRREVEMLDAKVSKMEDEVLHLIEEKEETEQLVARLAVDLETATEHREKLRQEIADKWRVIDKQIEVKEARKAEAAPLVEAYLMEIYDELRSAKEGRVVGPLVDGICGSCHLKLSAAEVARAVKDDPPRCIHCRSILVI